MGIIIRPEENLNTITYINFNGDGAITIADGKGESELIDKLIFIKNDIEENENPIKVVFNFNNINAVEILLLKLKKIKSDLTLNTSNPELDIITEKLWLLLDKINDECFKVNLNEPSTLKTFFTNVIKLSEAREEFIKKDRVEGFLKLVEKKL
jgi:hypothetical protein